MNRLLGNFLLLFALITTGCASPTSTEGNLTKLDRRISLFESSCVNYYEDVISRKLGDDKSPESRKKWEDVFYVDYRFAKDIANPEDARLKAIEKAYMLCDVQRKLNI